MYQVIPEGNFDLILYEEAAFIIVLINFYTKAGNI